MTSNTVPVVLEDLRNNSTHSPAITKKSFPGLEASSPRMWELELLRQDVL